MRSRLVAGVLALGLVAVACGSEDAAAPLADNGPAATLPEPAAGPVPVLPVDDTAATSPLPEIAVRQLNGDGGWVQFKNELPADRAVLVWFWAPH